MKALLNAKSFVVCMGSGGVGKTTVSATLGLLAAMNGKKTLVVTIDPAKRLAQALGLKAMLKKPTRLAEGIFEQHGVTLKAPVDVMMLDMKQAWDDLVRRVVKDKTHAKAILDNRFYGYLSEEMAGSQEFIACETLYQLHTAHDYEMIILDTPPTVHALDFIDAPSRMIDFLDQEAFRYFLAQRGSFVGKMGLSFLGGAAFVAEKVLERLTGSAFVKELLDFVLLLQDLYDPLVDRAKAFRLLLASQDAAFMVVCAPKEQSLCEAKVLHDAIMERALPFEALIANGLMPKSSAKQEDLRAVQDRILRGNLDQALADQIAICQAEEEAMSVLREWLPAEKLAVMLPRLMEDVHTPQGLSALLFRLVEVA